MSRRPSSADLKNRIVDFMERADELLSHELADYKAPFTLSLSVEQSTGDVKGAELDHNLLAREKLVYFATIERPILWTESEPIYVKQLVAALGRDHPELREHCRAINQRFMDWRNRVFIGLKSNAGSRDSTGDDVKLTRMWTAPAGTPLPKDDLEDIPMVDDMYFAKVYLNGFVWHNDSPKTAEYRAASETTQRHYRKCAEIRVFSGLQQVIKPIHQYVLDARAAGEDL